MKKDNKEKNQIIKRSIKTIERCIDAVRDDSIALEKYPLHAIDWIFDDILESIERRITSLKCLSTRVQNLKKEEKENE